MKFAHDVAKMSWAMRLKVGAVAARDRRVIALGYNGTPAGEDNCCEDWVTDPETGLLVSVTKPNVIHAESNLINFSKENNIDLNGCTLYITHSPCAGCGDKIIEAGFKEVIFGTHYRIVSNLHFLSEAGVKVRQWQHS